MLDVIAYFVQASFLIEPIAFKISPLSRSGPRAFLVLRGSRAAATTDCYVSVPSHEVLL